MTTKKAPPKTEKGDTKADVEAKVKPKPVVAKPDMKAKIFWVKHTDVLADHELNTSRATLYKEDGKKVCFQDEDVASLAANLLEVGQQEPVQVHAAARGKFKLHKGYRRHTAFKFLAKAGDLDKVPHSSGGMIACIEVAKPKNEDEWLAAAKGNLAENMHKSLSRLDIAHAMRRFAQPLSKKGEFGLGLEAARKIVAPLTPEGKVPSARQAARYLQLLKLPLSVQGKVHRGELSWTKACNGEGGGEGDGEGKGGISKRRGVKLSAIREMMEDGRFNEALKGAGAWSAKEVTDLVAFISGHSEKTDHSWFKAML